MGHAEKKLHDGKEMKLDYFIKKNVRSFGILAAKTVSGWFPQEQEALLKGKNIQLWGFFELRSI